MTERRPSIEGEGFVMGVMGDDRRQYPRARPEESSETSGDNGSENAHWQALLKRFGFEALQLPGDGMLAGQWKEFLKELEAKELRAQKTRKGHQ